MTARFKRNFLRRKSLGKDKIEQMEEGNLRETSPPNKDKLKLDG